MTRPIIQRVSDLALKTSEALLALMLASMIGMVLLNVVMRYVFGSGISATEELSRTVFVWLTFCGAVVASYQREHLGVDSLVQRLPHAGKVACAVASELIILACCVLVFWGTWRQHEVNATNRSLTTGMSLIWVFGIGYIVSLGMGLCAVLRIWRITTETLPDAELLERPPQAGSEAAL